MGWPKRLNPAAGVLLLIAVGTTIRLAMAGVLGLGIDESYMVAAGRVLRWGYFDHPPISWWLSSGAAHLLGSEAPIVVRLPFILLFAGSTWLMFRLTTELYGARAGLWASLAFNLSPVFGLTTGGWVLPDGPLMFALLAAGLCLVRAVEGRGTAWWLGTGVCAGLALMSKYSAGLVLGGAFLGLVTQPRHRVWLVRVQPYLAVLLAAAIFAPVVVWNARHGWASLAFQGGRAAGAVFRPLALATTLAGQSVFLLPWIWLGLVVCLVRALRAGVAEWRGWLLAWLALPPIVLFTAVSVWTRNVLYHWAAPGYLFLFPLLGAWLQGWAPAARWARGTAIAIGVVLVVVGVEVRFDVVARLTGGASPSLQAVDWTPLRPALAARGLLDGAVLAGPTWNDTGKLDYGIGGDPRVICLNVDARQYGFSPGPESVLGRDVLILAPRQDFARIEGAYGGVFDRIEELPPLSLAFPGRRPMEVRLFLGHHLRHWP